MKNIEAIVFDLDGTLLDTIDDLAYCCNAALMENGFATRTRDEVLSFVGNGLGVLIDKAVPGGRGNPLYEKVLSSMRRIYSENWHNRTKPYDGIQNLLEALSRRSVKIGIVSNKPDAQVKELAQLFFSGTVDVEFCVGEREADGIKRKPAPDSLLHVLEKMGVEKNHALYVGDSDVDIMTARNAEMDCVSVCWGFRTRDFLIESGATVLVESPMEILNLISASYPFLRGDVARDLDFYRIRSEVASMCVSEEGRTLLGQRECVGDTDAIEEWKSLGREWNRYIHSDRAQCLFGWTAVKNCFPLLGVDGAGLSQEEIYSLAVFCTNTDRAKRGILGASEDLNLVSLGKIAEKIPDMGPAREKIFSVVDSSGQLRDLPQLRAVRAKILSLQKEIESAVRRYTTDPKLSSALQSNVPAYRQDRELLAVRSDHRSDIKGIVHEVSASGQTVFIEPDEIVFANNALVQTEFELQSEIRKIFSELTFSLGEWKDDFFSAHELMLSLDMSYAAASWQNRIGGVFAELCDLEKEPPAIVSARHPLLGDRAVPIDVRFMDGKRVLIITGPNTGGKTVTLKTFALFAMLNQAGFPVPAAEGTRLPVFSSIFADIGDEQSIDESLSTFSSHMKKMATVMDNADSSSLVLLDELGSGTDPQEGGAIAMAALDTLIERKSFVLVTTHHGILKNYGYTNPSCVNASVEFSPETMSPTYRLMMGVPGESHAIDIALRSGLPKSIVEKARSYIASEQADVSTLIRGLNQKHIELDNLHRMANESLSKTEEKEIRLRQREIALREKELKLMELEKTQSFEFLSGARKKLENLVRTLREGEINREKTLGVKNFISEITGGVENQEKEIELAMDEIENDRLELKKAEAVFAENGMKISSGGVHKSSSKKKGKKRLSNSEALLYASVPESTVPASNEKTDEKKSTVKIGSPSELLFAPGIEVYAGKERRPGTLVQKNRNGTWTVLFGSMRMSVKESQLVPVKRPDIPPTASVVVETAGGVDKEERPCFELRLLGMRQDEAMRALERQLDLCLIYNFRSFSIVHGKGQGILQQSVQNYLSHYPGVRDFRFAPPEDGGSGKTYVTLF